MIKSKTAMGAAFENSGVRQEEVEYTAAISRFWNQGGSIERGREIYDALAKRMPGGGQVAGASDGQVCPAAAGQPIGGGEAKIDLPQGHGASAASPSSSRGGEGQIKDASGGHQQSAPPVSEPSASYLKAAGESRKEAARNILYRYRTSTGVWWADIHPYEVVGMTRDSVRGMALMSAAGPLNSAQMKMTFVQLLKPAQAQIAMEKADEDFVNVK